MDKDKWVYIAFAIIWISVAIAISVSIYVTHEWKCLFFFILPSLYEIRHRK